MLQRYLWHMYRWSAGYPQPSGMLGVATFERAVRSLSGPCVCCRSLQVLQMAVQTLRPNIVEVALDLIHKMIAFR